MRLADITAERPRPLYPRLLAAYPVVLLYASNYGHQIPVGAVVLALVAGIGGAAVMLVVVALLLGSAQRAALAVGVWVVLFYAYGRVWDSVPLALVDDEPLVLGAWGLIAVLAVVIAARMRSLPPTLTRWLNLVVGGLVMINVAWLGVRIVMAPPVVSAAPGPPVTFPTSLSSESRDVYYLVFDRYGAASTLEGMGLDNTPFLDSLRDRGFVLPEGSRANYPKTAHSLASSLNMGYLDFLTERVGPGSADWNPVYGLLAGSRVADAFRDLGYRYVHIGSRWNPTQRDPSADLEINSDTMAEFSQVLYQTTVLGGLSRTTGLFSEQLDLRVRERRRTLYQFEALERVARMPEPTFTFAHILLPHEPYLFEADGTPLSYEAARKRGFEQLFTDQVRFANRKIDAILDVLLAGSDAEDPVILLQADEGPHPRRYTLHPERFRWPDATDEELRTKLEILNAYYLPGPGEAAPYPGISPVNSFRLVLSRYFGAQLPLLPDRSHVFVDERHLYDFVEVTGRLAG